MEKEFYTAQELADKLDFNVMTIYRYIKSGELKASKIGKEYRIPSEEYEKLINTDGKTKLEGKVTELEKENKRLKRSIKKEDYGLRWFMVPEGFDDDVENKLPILRECKGFNINSDDSKATHIMIEGDNYHALTCLNYTHKNDIDVIYIDPPYNRGDDDFRYKDKRIIDKYPDGTDVPKDHPFRHSYWLSFMNKRLDLARKLLTDDGVIFISIGRDEFAQLKLLCDEIFGESNFITNFIWEKTQHFGRQKINFYQNADYILAYAKNLYDKKGKKKELLVEKIKTEHEDAPLYNASNVKNKLRFPAGTVKFNIKDGKYKKSTNKKYKLLNTVIVKNGKNKNELDLEFKSRWSQRNINKQLKVGSTFWVKSNSFAIRVIYGEGKTSKESSKQIIFTNKNSSLCVYNRFGKKVGVNEEGSKELKDIIGEQNIFEYPKPSSLIEYLLSCIFDYSQNVYKTNLKVLDFFAGSGTTGQAVLNLNKEDGGSRQFVLVNNNESGIIRKVCHPRVKNVIKGYKNKKGLGGSVKYYKTGFVGKNNVLYATDKDKTELAHNVGELLAIAENTLELVRSNKWYQLFKEKNKENYTAIYFKEELDKFDKFIKEILKVDGNISVYVFSWEDDVYIDEFEDRSNIGIKTIPKPILEIYKQIYNLV